MSSFYNSTHKYCDATWGVNTKFGYTWAGEPYTEPGKIIPDRYKGKTLSVPARDAPFSKLDYKGEPFTGGFIRYANAGQKVYPNPAFGSKDFSKTDEFSGYSRMVVYREQVAKELKVAEKALQRAAEMTLMSNSSGSDSSERDGEPTTPTRSTRRLGGTRDFASPTQFDRLRDLRSSKEIYNVDRFYKAAHSADFGATTTSNMAYAEDLPTPEEMREMSSPNKRVAVTKQFYRGNGVWSSITGAMP